MKLRLLFLALAALASACRDRVGPSFLLADGRLPNVLLITVDTLRADHLGCYSPAAEKMTPNIDRLASQAVLFEHAAATVPVTKPSLSSLHTGRYPGNQPVRTNRMPLPGGIPLLAELLAAKGYTTAAFYGNILLNEKSGLARGFGSYTSFVPMTGASSPRGVAFVRGWLETAPRQPWFLWVHFMDPHGPYDSAPLSWSEGMGEDALPDVVLPFSPTDYGLGMIPKYQRLEHDHAGVYRRRYRGEVHFTDAEIGRLLALLDEKVRAETVIVLTADHGESLGEHDLYFQHGWFPYEEGVRVPLIVQMAGAAQRSRRVAEPVSLVDVLPTLAGGLGVPLPAGVEGRDLRPALAGERLPAVPVFTVTGYLNQMTAIRRENWKLVHTPKPPEIAAGDPWAGFYAKGEAFALYDLASDPGETRDQSAAEPERARAMRDELLAWENSHGVPMTRQPQAQIDPATRDRLKALGYGS